MKTMSPLLLTLMLAGCANAYKEAYVPAQGVTPEAIAAYRKGAAPTEPTVVRGGPADLDALVQELAKRGYRGIGQASFTSSRQVPSPGDRSGRARQAGGGGPCAAVEPKLRRVFGQCGVKACAGQTDFAARFLRGSLWRRRMLWQWHEESLGGEKRLCSGPSPSVQLQRHLLRPRTLMRGASSKPQ
jgi:hypothetical protein